MDDLKIYEELLALHQAGKSVVLATVVESAGSAPRKAGAKMLVGSDGSTRGTIGGGSVELETIEAAQAALASGIPIMKTFMLTEQYGHVCGGRLLVYIEPVNTRPDLLIIGAGHVGKALAGAALFAGFRVLIADERPEYATRQHIPEATEFFIGDPAAALSHFAVTGATSVVITTPGFETDFIAVREALKTPAGYIGMIGSIRKRKALEQTLLTEGYTLKDIGRVIIPVGLSIDAETPEEIAVSIVAQLIQSRRSHGAAQRVGDSPCSRQIEPDGVLQTIAAVG